MSLGRRLISTHCLRHVLWLCWVLWVLVGTVGFAQEPQLGTISGRVIVPPDIILESEPNDDFPQAQVVAEKQSILGNASLLDPKTVVTISGMPVNIEDLYRIQTTGRTQVVLTIAANNPFVNDLDLFLFSPAGEFLNVSQGLVSTEVLEIPAGDFVLGIRAFQGSSGYLLVAQSADLSTLPPTVGMTSTAPFRPGEVIVKFKPSKLSTSQSVQRFAEAYGFQQTVMAPDGTALLQHVQAPVTRATNAQGNTKLGTAANPAQELKAVTLIPSAVADGTDVEFAEPNYIQQALRVPNDEFYDSQWHYELINLPEAWDLTIGDEKVIVAVIDTGALLEHPDLSPRLIDGFDFIMDPGIAGDGDGPDSNANDPGDDPRGQSSSFHGTHVAGTIGAATNNGDGVAGVTWQARIMPLRALGIGGGTTFDITQAILYAAGLPNASGEVPPERAHIINMSLGGPGVSLLQQNAIASAGRGRHGGCCGGK